MRSALFVESGRGQVVYLCVAVQGTEDRGSNTAIYNCASSLVRFDLKTKLFTSTYFGKNFCSVSAVVVNSEVVGLSPGCIVLKESCCTKLEIQYLGNLLVKDKGINLKM
jgi:hypothetical protein